MDLMTHAALTHPTWCVRHEDSDENETFHVGEFDRFTPACDGDYAVAVGAHRHDECLHGQMFTGPEYVRLEVTRQPFTHDPQMWLDAPSARRLALALLRAANQLTE